MVDCNSVHWGTKALIDFCITWVVNYIRLSSQDSTNFREWKLVLQEIVRFTKADTAFTSVRPLRYCSLFDSDPTSLPYVARFHARKVLKFQDAVLTSYHKNEVINFLI